MLQRSNAFVSDDDQHSLVSLEVTLDDTTTYVASSRPNIEITASSRVEKLSAIGLWIIIGTIPSRVVDGLGTGN